LNLFMHFIGFFFFDVCNLRIILFFVGVIRLYTFKLLVFLH
jgi:hypothetical protein